MNTTSTTTLRALKGALERKSKLYKRLVMFAKKRYPSELNAQIANTSHKNTPLGRSVAYDRLIFERIVGRYPILDRFGDSQQLSSIEKSVLADFKNEFTGTFLLGERFGPVFDAFNLVDMRGYLLAITETDLRAESLRNIAPGAFCTTRTIPVPGNVLVMTGPRRVLSASQRSDAISEAERMAILDPRLNLRNPEFLDKALKRQSQTHQTFLEQFKAPMFVGPISALEDGMRHVFDLENDAPLPGLYGKLAEVAEKHATTMLGLHSHPREGIGVSPNLGDYLSALDADAQEDLAPHCLQFVKSLVGNTDHSPALLDAGFARNPSTFNRILQKVLEQPDIDWAKDRAAFLAKHKPWYSEETLLPRITLFDATSLEEREARWHANVTQRGTPFAAATKRPRKKKRR